MTMEGGNIWDPIEAKWVSRAPTPLEDPCKKHRFITTRSGEKIVLGQMRPEQVRLEDIVFSLARQTRYMGHCEFYSVAEHVILTAEISSRMDVMAHPHFRKLFVKCALAHDFAEAYTGDHPSPEKEEVPEIRTFERKIEDVVLDALGLPSLDHAIWPIVKQCDLIALSVEARQLFSPVPDWVSSVEAKYDIRLQCLEPREAHAALRVAVRSLFGNYEERQSSILAIAQKLR